MNCWLKFRKHTWGEQYLWGDHRRKKCLVCRRSVITAHIGCHEACWGGPG